MTLTRRRFMTIAAACAAVPGAAQALGWRGRAFGAQVSISIKGPRGLSDTVLGEVVQTIREVEGLFSLYDPGSALSQLNRDRTLPTPDPRFIELMAASDHAHTLTGGLFDPSIQRLWEVYAKGNKPTEYYHTIGWDRVRFDTTRVTLGPHQALTFNGIAQGYATDKVTQVLAAHGLTNVLVNIGEYRGMGGPWRLGLQDPEYGMLGTRTLGTGAIATSSPQATPLVNGGHIIHLTAQPQWSTVSVEAPSATLADSLSTAMVLAPRDQIEAIRESADITRVTLVDFEGNLVTL